MYKAFLIDLDGTAYLGDKVVKETVGFVKRCKDKGQKILFITNNASKTQEDIYDKLINMGYDVEVEEIYTSAIAMASYLKDLGLNEGVYVIGDDGLKKALDSSNIRYTNNLDYEIGSHRDELLSLKAVVVGYTNSLSYKDLGCASIVLQNNDSKFFATNKDLVIPSVNFNLPGNGSIVKLLEQVNNTKALEVGKPSNIIMDEGLKLLGLNKEEVCMIGDNYKTDILAGINNGIDTIFVETGVNTMDEVRTFDKLPTYMVKNLSEINM